MVLNFTSKFKKFFFNTSRNIDEGVNTQKNKYGVWSCSGSAFHTMLSSDTVTYTLNTGKITLSAATGDKAFQTTINIPHGAIIESFQVWGADTLEEASVFKVKNTNSTSTLLKTVNIGTRGVLNEEIDLETYSYIIECSAGVLPDSIYGAEVHYSY